MFLSKIKINEKNMSFNIVLRELRVEKGLSQKELGNILNTAGNTITNWEKGKAEPNINTLLRLADIFNVSLDFLCGRKEEGTVIEYYEPIPISKEERELLNYYKRLNKNNKFTLIGFSRGLVESQPDRD